MRFLLASLVFTCVVQNPLKDRARVEVPPGPFHVGQCLDLRVIVHADQPPRLVRPAWTDGDVYLLPTQKTAGSPSRFVLPVRIIPRRPGRLNFPPLTIQFQQGSQTIPVASLNVRGIPTVGRTSTFSGGVGKIEPSSEAKPTTVREGETIEWKIVWKGPGAAGSTVPEWPNLQKLGLQIQAQPLPSEFDPESLTRTFRTRLRPLKAGSASLPPIRVSWLDPVTNRFQTTVSPAIPIHVLELEVFDSSSVVVDTEPSASWTWIVGILAGLVGGLLILGWRFFHRRPETPSRFAAKLVREIEKVQDPAELGRKIPQALARFFTQFAGRPEGVLTPVEASQWVLVYSCDKALAVSAAALIAKCDHISYGGNRGDGENLREAAKLVFVELSRTQKPREALGTTSE